MSAASGIMERPAIWPVLSSLAIPTGASPFHNPSFCETADWAGTTAFQNLILFSDFLHQLPFEPSRVRRSPHGWHDHRYTRQ